MHQIHAQLAAIRALHAAGEFTDGVTIGILLHHIDSLEKAQQESQQKINDFESALPQKQREALRVLITFRKACTSNKTDIAHPGTIHHAVAKQLIELGYAEWVNHTVSLRITDNGLNAYYGRTEHLQGGAE